MDYQQVFAGAISSLRAERRHRVFIELERTAGQCPRATNHANPDKPEVVVWCSNDDLGMGQHKVALDAMTDAISTIARLLPGTVIGDMGHGK